MLRTFKSSPNYEEFKKICQRESIGVGDKINEFIEDYVKVHSNGNPQYTIQQFQDPDFLAYPAFAQSHQKLSEWFYNFKQKVTKKQIDELRFKIQEWNHLFKESFGSL